MAQVTVEYMILIPVLIVQIFFFPYTASLIMDSWAESRQTLALQEVAGHLGSVVQQVYYTSNSIPNGTVQVNVGIPENIENLAYATTLRHAPTSDGTYNIMNISMQLNGAESVTYTLVTLGNNIDWAEGLTFLSTAYTQSNPLVLTANKTADNIWLSVGGA